MWKLRTLIIFTTILCFVDSKQSKLPDNLSIGVSTAAFQIEGGWNVGGKGPSIWDTFTHDFPDRIVGNETADVACNSYHKFQYDLEALIDLKVDHYRFSISWTRIMSNGDNSTFNPKGVEYYNYVINELLKHNITPIVTMFHWDLPDELMKIGGMTNPEFIDYFTDYSITLFQLFGDRVKTWITFNEPYNCCVYGYGIGNLAPAINNSGIADYLCLEVTLKAHAITYRTYKDSFYKKQGGRIGISLSAEFYFAKDNFNLVYRAMQYKLGFLAHPIFSKTGGYPELLVKDIRRNSKKENRPRSRLPQLNHFWKSTIRGSADFLGINYYFSNIVEEQNPPTGPIPSFERDLGLNLSADKSWKRGYSEWLYMVPEGLENVLKFIRDEYDNVEVIITENGWSDDGELYDYDRIEYIRSHVQAVLNAIDDGCNVTGYTVWSLLDSFEWVKGYSARFGLYFIDFKSKSKKRYPKLSAKFYTMLNTDRAIPTKDFHYFDL